MRQHNLGAILNTNAQPEMKLAAAVILRGIDDAKDTDRKRQAYTLDALDFFDTKRCHGWISIAFPSRKTTEIQRMIWCKLFDHIDGCKES